MPKPIKDYQSLPGYDTKDFAPITASIDEEQGIVEAIVAVMGNVDHQGDVIMPGAFAKTIVERGADILILDNHRTDSTDAILGKPLGLREIGRTELPLEVMEKYPEATGALLASMQFLLKTPEGMGAFERIKAKAVSKYSIGYDPIQKDFETLGEGDSRHTIRNLREIRLWEVSVVPFAANDATMTVSAKADAGPTEGKPWRVEERDGDFCVYKIDTDGSLDGEALKCYSDEAEAIAYLRALYANAEDGGGSPAVTLADKAETDADETKEGRVLSGRNVQRIVGALTSLIETLENAGYDVPRYAKEEGEEEKSRAPDKGRARDDQREAGPDESPPTETRSMLAELQTLQLEIELLEVT